jgi:hypothetical protein
VTEETEEVSIFGSNGSTLDKNMKGQSSKELNYLGYHEEELVKDG